jgi:hypothetical protein
MGHSLDARELFMHPVNEKEVPTYRDVIKQPMDFRQMRVKMRRLDYSTVQQLQVRTRPGVIPRGAGLTAWYRTIST